MRIVRGLRGRPVRQAYLWTALGVLGIAFAAIGFSLLTGGDEPRRGGANDLQRNGQANSTIVEIPRTPTSTATPAPDASPSPVASETPAATPEAPATATQRGQQNPSTGGSQQTNVPPQPTPLPPTPEPTSLPATARTFCNTTSSSSPPNSVFGLLTIGGQPGPAGTVVTITFDGAAGPSVATVADGGYRVDFPSGGEDCANRAGSSLAIVVSGQAFAAGTLGGNPANRVDITVP